MINLYLKAREWCREYKDDSETFWERFPAQRNTVLGVVVLAFCLGAFLL